MKHLKFILIILTIFCNEIVVELVLSDDHKVSIIDNAGEESNEKDNIELEAESDFVNKYADYLVDHIVLTTSSFNRNIFRIANPFLEIHCPPPDYA